MEHQRSLPRWGKGAKKRVTRKRVVRLRPRLGSAETTRELGLRWGTPESCDPGPPHAFHPDKEQEVCPSRKPTAVGTGSPKSASATVPGVAAGKLLPLGPPGAVKRGFRLWHPRLGTGNTPPPPEAFVQGPGHGAGQGTHRRGPLPRSGPDATSFRSPSVGLQPKQKGGSFPGRAPEAAKATCFEQKYLDTT